MKIGIIGAGAIGAITAYNLRRANDVVLIVDEGRKERYGKGFLINGEEVFFPLKTPSEAESLDLIIVAVKYGSLPEAIEEMRGFVGEKTTILALLNGLMADDMLEEAYPGKILRGIIVAVSSTHTGREIKCTTQGGTIIFGEKDDSKSERLLAVTEAFSASGQRYVIPESIMHEKYWKILLNSTFNTLTASLSADFHAVYGNEEFLWCVRRVGEEVRAVAKAKGVLLTEEDMEKAIGLVLSHPDHGRTSMYQDVAAGRNTENEYLAGYIVKIGKEVGVPTPCTEFCYHMLEARRCIIRRDQED